LGAAKNRDFDRCWKPRERSARLGLSINVPREERLLDEARSLARLAHENIVTVFDAEEASVVGRDDADGRADCSRSDLSADSECAVDAGV
jgi:hypothetical protein